MAPEAKNRKPGLPAPQDMPPLAAAAQETEKAPPKQSSQIRLHAQTEVAEALLQFGSFADGGPHVMSCWPSSSSTNPTAGPYCIIAQTR